MQAYSRSPCRLAIYVPSLRGGGAERVMVTLANSFAQRGYSVDLVLAKAEGPYLEEVATPVRVIDLSASRVSRSLPGLIRYLRREQPSGILSAMKHANVVAILASIISGASARVVVSERNNLSVSRKRAGPARSHFSSLCKGWIYGRADSVVAVSSGVADDLAVATGYRRSSIEVVYNPVVTDALKESSGKILDHPWFSPDGPSVILAVGRLEEQKGFAGLIKAFALLRETHEARLLILGEGSLRPELECMVQNAGLEDEILLPGFVDNPYVFMRHAGLFVLSSGWEGLPNALIQAMACGTPVVSTDCPSGPDEILEGGKWGRLVPVDDAKALSQAMANTLDETDHPDVSARAEKFTVDKAVDEYLRLLTLRDADTPKSRLG